MPRPIIARIHVDAMTHNLRVAKQNAPTSKVWAVVKSNAYGHGLALAVRGFAEADGLALIEVEDAILLREIGWTRPILLLAGIFEPSELQLIVENKLDLVVHNFDQLVMLEKNKLPSSFNVHVKVNTGMNRLGFVPQDCTEVAARLNACSCVKDIGFLTHFGNAFLDSAGAPGVSFDTQLARFTEVIGDRVSNVSFSNSPAVLTRSSLTADWIRPGEMLYGGTGFGRSASAFGLMPAMTLETNLISIQNIEAGDSVGYGGGFIATESMRIGVAACGFADGYPRQAPCGTPVLVEGVRARIVGRVSMDMLTIDLSSVPLAKIGSTVRLWGPGLPIDEVATASKTIGCDLMCALTRRVPVIEATLN